MSLLPQSLLCEQTTSRSTCASGCTRIAHSGDSIPASEGRDAPRFDAESASWATPTHEAFMVHAAAAAAARALARAIREYAKRRLIDHYLVEVADNAVAIPRPDISAFTA